MDKLYSIIEVAAKLGLSDKTLRRWEEAGRFTPSRTLGNQRRYSLEDLQILDAIKHGTINEQNDLLTVEQAGKLCGVSPATIVRWENEGKIHPLITSGNTYYPRQKLMGKMAELKKIYIESNLDTASVPKGSDPEGSAQPADSKAGGSDPKGNHDPKLSPLDIRARHASPLQFNIYLTNILMTLLLLLSYHLLFNQPLTPVSPQVQGVSTTIQDPRLDDLLTKFQDFVTAQNLRDAKPVSATTINLDNTSLIAGTTTLPKGKDQISITNEKITQATTVTTTFTSDFSPAKKYWVTTSPGSFTLHTDFPVGAAVSFNYSFLTLSSTASATLPVPITP